MFTGLVQTVGTIAKSEPTAEGRRLTLAVTPWDTRPWQLGESICLSGCCLTLAAHDEATLSFDVIHETLSKTTLGTWQRGARVNLERSVTPDTLLGGHVVQGHVEGVAIIDTVTKDEGWRIRIRPPAALMPCITPKGSITIDGVSLTVAAVQPREWFEVALIPETLARTTLADLNPAASCNIETDIMARTVIHWLEHYRDLA